jgi:ribose-phosphate pyrophosphokinase
MFEAAHLNRVVALDVHNLAAFQNAFRCPTVHLDARRPLVDALLPWLGAAPATVISPDAGGMKRAEAFRDMLARCTGDEVGSAFMEKFRSEGVVRGGTLVGDLEGRVAVIVDDLIASGGTMRRTARQARAQGASRVLAVATHGLFVEDAESIVTDDAFDAVLVSDSVPPFRLRDAAARAKVTVVPVGALFGAAIRRMQTGGSLVDLLEDDTA